MLQDTHLSSDAATELGCLWATAKAPSHAAVPGLGWDTHAQHRPACRELCTQSWCEQCWRSVLPVEMSQSRDVSWHNEAAVSRYHSWGAQVKLSHSILVTLWFMQSVRVPPGHEFTGCSGKVHGAQLGPWCSAQLSSLKAASLVFSAHVCQEHLCSFKRLAPCFFYFTPATTQAGSGSCWQVRTVTT